MEGIREIFNLIFTDKMLAGANYWLVILVKVAALILIGTSLVYLFLKIKESLKSQKEELELVAELKRVSSELRELDRAKSEFISIITHELKTPTSQIIGYISMLLEQKEKLPSDVVPLLESAFEGTRRMSDLISALIKASGIKSEAVKTPIEPSGVINKVIKKFESRAKEKGIDLVWEPPKKLPLPLIKISPSDLEEIFNLLLDNAINFTPKGKIIISSELRAQDSELVLSVIDTGIGISKKDLPHVFEKFYKVDTSHLTFTFTETGGIGMGLYLAKMIVELYGGKIWAESAGEGKGSKFSLSLPVSS